jgi:Ring finger domain
MGNTQSTSADARAAGQPTLESEAPSAAQPSPRLLAVQDDHSANPSQLRQPSARQRTSIYGSLRQRLSSRRTLTPPPAGHQRLSEEIEGEQEDRPLVHEGVQLAHQDQSLTSTPAPLTRSPSTVSRLGSRLLPDSVARVLLSSGEETAAEGRALRNGATERLRSAIQRQPAFDGSNRFSLTGSLRRRMDTRTDLHTDFRRHTIRGPFPLGATHQQLLNNENEQSWDTDSTPTHSGPISPGSDSLRRQTRLRRIRNSLSSPLISLLQASQNRSSRQGDRSSPHRPTRVAFADDSDHLLPPPSGVDPRPDLEDAPHELDAVESETRNTLAPTITSGMSTIRRFNRLRSRSTRLMRPENPPLSQVLQLAAAAIAAQLSGHAHPATSPGRTFGSEAFDGSIQNFVQTLQEAASAQAGETIDVNAAEGDLPPVNFMRVFQFPNDEHGSPITSQAQSRNVEVQDLDQITAPGENDRSVTLVLVGVRSMPQSQETAAGDGPLGGPSLDNLLSLPFLPPSNLLGSGSSRALFRRSDGRMRLNSRRHSMTNFSFPAQYESQRHHRTRTPGSLLSAEQAPGTNTPFPLSESPPGPNPPPSTPADIRSGQATPIRRPSSASAIHGATLPDLDENQAQISAESTPESAYNVARQRRRSDSEFARRPELGSGAARRNGMVEPDDVPPGAGRSWLIYVVGTNVSPDHPAFTMPSLFTDNPSYEDMQMLSALLGPVKPPVASQEDVASAGGLFRLLVRETGLVGEAADATSRSAMTIVVGERCLICLCEYEAAEEVRQLAKCQHVFHRDCIDEVRTRPLAQVIARMLTRRVVVDDRTKQLPDVPSGGRGGEGSCCCELVSWICDSERGLLIWAREGEKLEQAWTHQATTLMSCI